MLCLAFFVHRIKVSFCEKEFGDVFNVLHCSVLMDSAVIPDNRTLQAIELVCDQVFLL